MIAIIKNEDNQTRLINTEQILYSFKRDTGYGLIMAGDRTEIWLTWKEFDQLIEQIAKVP